MKKQVLIATTLSAVLLSAQALTQSVQADELDLTSPQTEAASGSQETTVSSSDSSASSQANDTTQATTTSGTDTTTSDSSDATTNEDDRGTRAATGGDSTDRVATTATSASTSGTGDTVTVLHTNDVHGRMLEDSNNGVIGDARLSGIVNASRAQGTTLVFDSGDSFQGLPISNSTEGEDMAKVMNAIGYDAMTVGNHEFDFGLDQLRQLSTQINFPIITSNVYVNGVRLFQPSTIVDKTPGNDGDEVVVIGVTTPETATKTHPRNLPGVTFTDPITEVKAVVDQMESNARAEGKDYKTYIILSHLGVDTTTPVEWRGSTLAEALSTYAPLKGKRVLVLDGHSHTLLTASYGDNVTYNQTGSYLNNVGRVVFNSDRVLSQGAISAKEAQAYPINPTVQTLLDAFKAQYEADSSKVVIANSPVKLSGDRMDVRVRETNLGNVVADALLDYGQSGFTHKSNLAVTNGGGLRETIAKDKPVTKGDIIAVLPFGNSVAQIQVTGQNIYDMFAKSLGSILQVDSQGQPILDENGQPLMEPSGGFLQTAGARVYYDTSLPAANRILSIAIWDPETDQYKPLNLGQTYYLVTNDFLAAGGDGFTMLGGPREEGPSMDSIFADYLTRVNLLDYAAIHPNSRTIAISRTAYMALTQSSSTSQLPAQSTATYTISAPVSLISGLQGNKNGAQSDRLVYRSLPVTGDQGTSTVLMGLGILLSAFGLVGKKKVSD